MHAESYVNETIMEVQAQQWSAHTVLSLHCSLYHTLDGAQSIGARVIVVIRCQLRET